MCFEYFIYFKGKIRWNIEFFFPSIFLNISNGRYGNNFEREATFHSEQKEIERGKFF